MADQKTKLFFPNLDGLRFIAFAFVFSEHILWACSLKFVNIQQPLLRHIVYTLTCNGGVGVSVFFVLSGFLITYLILSEVNLTGKINVGAFYVRRFLRIWPLYYALFVFAYIAYPYIQSLFHIDMDPTGIKPLYYLAFLGNFDTIYNAHHHLAGSFLTGVTWSIAVEEQFYLLWPLLFFIVPKKYYASIFIFFISMSLAFRLCNAADPEVLYFHSLSVCADLAVGGLAAYLSLNSVKFKSFFEFTPNKKRLLIYALGIVFILLQGYYLEFKYSVLYNRLLPGLFFAWIILDQNFNKNDAFKLSKMKWMSKWGKYTYGMYLLHEVAFLIVMNLSHHYNLNDKNPLAGLVKTLIIFIITLTLSYCSYHWFEKYFLKLKNKFAYFTKE